MAGNDVTINVKTKGTKKAKKAFKEVEGATASLKKAALGLGVAMGARVLAAQIGAAIGRAEEMNSAYAITEQIIKQTGGAANLTAQEIKDLSKEQSLLTGVNKALVTDGNNVLLTFKNLRDEVGAGNDIFTRTSGAMLDMAAVMKTDAKSAAIQLGKALNDPIANLGALGRAGVQFSVDQKKAIKSMVETGDLLGAQKIILKELESQFGGTAEASADASDKMSNAFLEVQEAVGNALLPALDKLAELAVELAPILEKRLVPAVEEVVDVFIRTADTVGALVASFDAFADAVSGFGIDLGFVGEVAGKILNPVGGLIDALNNWAVASDLVDESTEGLLSTASQMEARMGPSQSVADRLGFTLGAVAKEGDKANKTIRNLTKSVGNLGDPVARAITASAELAETLGRIQEDGEVTGEEVLELRDSINKLQAAEEAVDATEVLAFGSEIRGDLALLDESTIVSAEFLERLPFKAEAAFAQTEAAFLELIKTPMTVRVEATLPSQTAFQKAVRIAIEQARRRGEFGGGFQP